MSEARQLSELVEAALRAAARQAELVARARQAHHRRQAFLSSPRAYQLLHRMEGKALRNMELACRMEVEKNGAHYRWLCTQAEVAAGLSPWRELRWDSAALGSIPRLGRLHRLQLAKDSLGVTDELWAKNFHRMGNLPDSSWRKAMALDEVPGPDTSTEILARAYQESREMPEGLLAIRTLGLPAQPGAIRDYALTRMTWNVGEVRTMPAGSSLSVGEPHWLGSDILIVVDGIKSALPMVGRRLGTPRCAELLTTTELQFRVTHSARHLVVTTENQARGTSFHLAYRVSVL